MKRTIATVCLAGLALTGCGSSAEPAADCKDVPASTVSAISKDLTAQGFKSAKSAAVKAGDQFAVAITYKGNGEPITPVFAVSSLEGGMTMAVDGFAKEFTDWPQSPSLDASSDAVSAVKSCL